MAEKEVWKLALVKVHRGLGEEEQVNVLACRQSRVLVKLGNRQRFIVQEHTGYQHQANPVRTMQATGKREAQ